MAAGPMPAAIAKYAKMPLGFGAGGIVLLDVRASARDQVLRRLKSSSGTNLSVVRGEVMYVLHAMVTIELKRSLSG